MLNLLYQQIIREILIRYRNLRATYNAALFFIMIVTVFPLTMPPNSAIIHTITPGIIWIAMLFAIFLSSERIFSQDYEDGIIEQWLISGLPITIMIIAKLMIHCLINIIAIIIISPLLAILFQLNLHELILISITLIIGMPGILSFCALSEVFSTGLKQKNIIMAIIILPFSIPLLILGSETINQILMHQKIISNLIFITAFSIITFSFIPFAIAGVIRICLNDN